MTKESCIKTCIQGVRISETQAKILLVRAHISEENLLSQKDISEHLKQPLSTINYNIKQLKKRGLLDNLIFLTPTGKVVIQKITSMLNQSKKLRGHKIFGVLTLEFPYRDFEQVRNKFQVISKTHRGFRLEFEGCTILFYSSNKIVYYLPDIFADRIEDLFVIALDSYVRPLISYLEQMFKGIKIDQQVDFPTITINHCALQYHPLAETFKHFSALYGSDRLEVDCSNGVPELETIHKKYSMSDMNKILDYEKTIRGSDSRIESDNEGGGL